MIRVTFSDRTLNVSLPKGWHELSTAELRMVYRYLTVYEPWVAPVAIFCRLAGAKIVREVEGRTLLSFRLGSRLSVQSLVTPGQMASYVEHLNWLSSPGDIPVRLPKIGGNRAVDAQLHGVTFGDYLRIESLYQGYLQSQNADALLRLANVLYRGRHPLASLDEADILNVFNWATQVKAMFATTFKHFFRPTDGGDTPDMAVVMNAQIRALTGGDVAKEEQILAIDCWRALTELDAKAREAEELRKLTTTKR